MATTLRPVAPHAGTVGSECPAKETVESACKTYLSTASNDLRAFGLIKNAAHLPC